MTEPLSGAPPLPTMICRSLEYASKVCVWPAISRVYGYWFMIVAAFGDPQRHGAVFASLPSWRTMKV